MRLHRIIASFFLVLALALLPLGGLARASGAAGAQPAMAAMDASAPIDDCCLPHGATDDPCKSTACCAAHCTSVAPILQIGFLAYPKHVSLAPVVRDQVFASTIGSPPFRPPRV